MPDLTTPPVSGRLSRSTIALSVLGAVFFLYLRNFRLPAVPFAANGDQNQFFSRAVRILHGQVPYRDFFAFVTPGTEYVFAAGFRIFGVHAWVISAWSVIVGLAFCWVLTRIASCILRGPAVLLPALLFLAFAYNGSPDLTHHWFSTLAALCAAGVLMGGVTTARVAAAGILCAVATLFTQTEGVAAFIAIALYITWRAFRDVPGNAQRTSPGFQPAVFSLSFSVILAAALGPLARAAGWRTLFFDLVLFAPRYLSSTEINSTGDYLRQFPPLHTAADLLRFVPVLFIYALVPYIYVIGFFRIVRNRRKLAPGLLENLVLIHAVGIALFVSVAHSARLFRLTTVAAPAVLVCVWLLVEEIGAKARIRAFLLKSLGLAALAFALVLIVHRQAPSNPVLDLPIGRTAFSDPLSAREFRWLARRTRPGEAFFNNSSLALYLEQRNPTELEFINDREFTRPEQISGALVSLQHDPPHFIVLEPSDPLLPATGDHTAPIRQFVEQNYDLAAVFLLNEGVAYQNEIWERKPQVSLARP